VAESYTQRIPTRCFQRRTTETVPTILGLAALIIGIVLVVVAADWFVDGLLGLGRHYRVAPFVLTVALSGMEAENLAAGIAANVRGLEGAAAGSFLGGIVFLSLGVAGVGALIYPMDAKLPRSFGTWTALAPVPLLVLGLDGHLTRFDGALLLIWFAVALIGLARSGAGLHVETPGGKKRFWSPLIGGLAGLTAGGWALGVGLHSVVRNLGASQTFLGNTAVAATVEVEELGRVTVATRRGHPEIAIANLGGTIVHFASLNAAIIALVDPLRLSADTLHFYLPAAAAAPAVLVVSLSEAEGRWHRKSMNSLLDVHTSLSSESLQSTYTTAKGARMGFT
jgi:cation:H+ antiporter